jgi:hypothetical protein
MPAPPGGEGVEEEEEDPCRVRIPEVLSRMARGCRWRSHRWLQWWRRIDPFPSRVATREEDLAPDVVAPSEEPPAEHPVPGSTHTEVLIPRSGCVEQ